MTHDKAIMFDLDGTITNTLPLALEGSRVTIKQVCGADISYADIKFLFGKSEGGLFKKFCPDRWEECVRVYARYFKAHTTPAIIFPGMPDVFEYLKNKNVRMALVTGRGSESTEVILEKTGIKHYFEYVKTGSELGSIKAQCMKEVLAAWQQPGHKTFYIGDVPHDVSDARIAGLKPLSCAWFEFADVRALSAEQPYKIFNKVPDFFSFIKAEFN